MARSRVQRILGAASRLAVRSRLRGRTPPPTGADELLLEAQKATYRELHRRFSERAERGEGGLASGLEALDAMWHSVRQLRAGAPIILGTLAGADGDLQEPLAAFYEESTALLEDAIRRVFAEDLGSLTLPPDRMAVLIRVLLQGLFVELAHAHTDQDLDRVDQAYTDARELFERFVLSGMVLEAAQLAEQDPIPLPW